MAVEQMHHLALIVFFQRLKRPEEILAHTAEIYKAFTSVILLNWQIVISFSTLMDLWSSFCKAEPKYSKPAPAQEGYFLLPKYKYNRTGC